MSSIGSNPTLIRPGELNQAAWSPDGQRIVFTRLISALGELQGPQIWVMNANGTGETMLTNDILSSYDPAWSPDGSRIAFTRDTRILLMNADGSAQRALTNPGPGERDEEARWSPDGSRLAFVRVRTSIRDLWTINPDGSNPRRLTNFDFPADGRTTRGYSWAPDGERLTYSDRFDVYTIRHDGSDATNLTNSSGLLKFDPSWSPDGGSILYTADVGPVRDIFVVDVNSHSSINLTNGTDTGWISERAMWQP
jgi:TolB protein